jgi:unsaturated chondroitin disaccharide hydrolase
MTIDKNIPIRSLSSSLDRLFELAVKKSIALDRSWNSSRGAPVVTVEGKYASRSWTQWTEGFQYGSLLLAFDATDDPKLLKLGRERTIERMTPHVTHMGVHDHGFNNLSTYGNLHRLMREGRIRNDEWERKYYELALKASGAVQAARWSGTPVRTPSAHSANSTALGYIHSFNGAHSLFIDTMRTLRILGVAHQLGGVLMHENDRRANLLKRSVLHGLTTSQYLMFHGDSDHNYDVRGRVSHEALFNRTDGAFRSRSTQQGYSPFSTWTRGLAWAMLGFAEELEFFDTISASDFKNAVGLLKNDVVKVYERCARETCDHWIEDVTAADGIPYWDDGAPNLHKLGDWRSRPAEIYNDFEPVDASAAAIAAQGLIRLGNHLGRGGAKYLQAGLTVAQTVLSAPYLSMKSAHEGLLLHSVYHRPNNWDAIPRGRKIPCDESSMWGDYHLLELGVLLQRMIDRKPYLRFFAA